MTRKVFFPLLSLFFLLSLIPTVHAEDINLLDVPQKVGEAFGIPEPYTNDVGGLFITMVVFLAFVTPTLILRNKSVALIMMFLVLAFCCSLQWIPTWIMVMVVVIAVGVLARKMRRWLS